MPRSRPRFRDALVAPLTLCAMALGACDSAPQDAPSDGPGTLVTSVPVDALLVMVRQDGGQRAIHLVDPATGKASAYEFYAVSDVAISPDGQRIAYVGPSNGTVVVARAVLADGLPALEIEKQFEGLQVDAVAWSPDGDRLHTRDTWLDPATGDVARCGPEHVSEHYPLATFPGGHRYVCTKDGTLYDDGRYVGQIVGSLTAGSGVNGGGVYPSADGQFYDPGMHVPSGTVRSLPVTLAADVPNLWGVPPNLRLPSGQVLLAPGGTDGKGVIEEPAGFVTLYKIVEHASPPTDAALYDAPDDAFETGVWDPAHVVWPAATALAPWLTDGDGRSYRPIALLADGSAVIYAVASWVITHATDGTNVIYQTLVEGALVEVRRDGTSRGFKVRAVADAIPLFTDARLLDLGGGDWLVSAASAGGHTLFTGYRAGKAVAYAEVTLATPDGRWLYGARPAADAAGPQHCFRDLRGGAAARCFPVTVQGTAVGFMAQGLGAAHASDAPLVLGTSRAAAWPGSAVVVFGAHFGTTGTVAVGDVTVPAADIVAWTDHAITFTMSAALPASGRLTVTTAAGQGGQDRPVMLARTARVATPFDGLTGADLALGQGLNTVDLGMAAPFDRVALRSGPALRLDPALRDAQGRYFVYADGAPVPTTTEVILHRGAHEHALRFTLEDRLADATRWQPVGTTSLDPVATDPAFVTLAGDLVERSSGVHPQVSARVTFAQAGDPRPDFFRPGVGGVLTATGAHVSTLQYAGWTVRLLTGWVGTDGVWGTAVFAASPNVAMPNYFRGVAADGPLMVFTGADPLGYEGGAYFMSRDGGATRDAPTVLTKADFPGALQEPLYVAAQAPFFLVLEASYNAPGVTAVHAIGRDGVLTPNVIAVPEGALLPGGAFAAPAPVLATTLGGRALFHFGGSRTLVMADFDAAAPSWATLPTAANAGHVRSVWEDEGRDLWVVLDSGTVMRATAAGGWGDWAVVDLGIDLAAPTRVVPAAVAKLPDGRLLVAAQLFDAAPGAATNAPSLVGPAAWLVGPMP